MHSIDFCQCRSPSVMTHGSCRLNLNLRLAPAPHLNRTFVRVIFKSVSLVFLPPIAGSLFPWREIAKKRKEKKQKENANDSSKEAGRKN